MLRLGPSWRKVVLRAWSSRFIAAAFVFSMAEVALPYLEGTIPVSKGWFGILAGVASAGAFVSRLIVQKDLTDAD